MAKALAGLGVKPRRELPRVDLIPVETPQAEARERGDEIQRLIAEIVMSSHRRGRKKKNYDQEDSHAA